MTKKERAQLETLKNQLVTSFQVAKALNDLKEDDAQYWDGKMSGLATAINRLRAILD